jgi:hypothetical protein
MASGYFYLTLVLMEAVNLLLLPRTYFYSSYKQIESSRVMTIHIWCPHV